MFDTDLENLPEIDGTPKQIPWATEVRERLAAKLLEHFNQGSLFEEVSYTETEQGTILENFRATVAAGFWIDCKVREWDIDKIAAQLLTGPGRRQRE